MNKSKFLKKSLAAFLAILMVAAMIPMSAFAADEPEAPAVDPGYIIQVDGKEAKWENGGYTADYSLTAGADDITFGMSWAPVSGTTLQVKESAVTLSNSVQAISLADSKEKRTEFTTGAYSYTLVATTGDATVEYELTVNLTVTQPDRNVTVTGVDSSSAKEIVSGSVSDHTITLVMALDFDNTSDHITVLTAENAQVTLTEGSVSVKDSAGNAFSGPDADTKVSNVLKKIFKVENTSAVLSLGEDGLKVTAAGDTKTYTIDLKTESFFSSFSLGGNKGEIDGDTITVKLPFNTTDDDIAAMKATWTQNANVKDVKFGTTGSETAITPGATLSFKDLTEGEDKNTTALAADSSFIVVTKNTADEGQTITINLEAPAKNPDAKLTAIQIGANGQKYAIADHEAGKGIINVPVELPRGGVSADGKYAVTLYGPSNATVVLGINDNGEFGTNNGTANAITAGKLTSTKAVSIPADGYALINVKSQDGNTTIQYKVTVTENKKSDTSLSDIKLVNAAGEQVGTVAKNGNNYTITVPHSYGADSTTLKALQVVATAPTSSSIAYKAGGSFSGTTNFVSGMTVRAVFGDTAALDPSAVANTATLRVWNNGTGPDADTISKADYVITLAKAAPSAEADILSAKITSATDAAAAEAAPDSVYTAAVNKSDKTLKVTLPYSDSDAADRYFAELKLSDGAHAILEPTTGDGNTLINTMGIEDHSGTADKIVDASNAWTDATTTAVPVKIWVFSESAWADVNEKAIAAPAGGGGGGGGGTRAANTIALADLEKLAKVYSLTGTVTPAETGNDLLSIASTLDGAVKVVKDDASRTITITAPNSYDKASNAPTFSLNIETSPLAVVKMDPSKSEDFATMDATIVSDKGSADTANRTMFAVQNGELSTSISSVDTPLTSGKIGYLSIDSERGGDVKQWIVRLVIAEAEADATISGITAAGAEAEQSTEEGKENQWNLTLPYGSVTEQVLEIATSKLATVYVNGAKFDAAKAYDLSKEVAIRVVAEDGSTEQEYTLVTTVAEPNTDATLAEVKVGDTVAQIAEPVEGESTIAVKAVLEPSEELDLTKQTVTATATDKNAKIEVAGEAYTAPVELNVSEPVAIKVTAEDGKTVQEYTLTVEVRELNTAAEITGLTVNGEAVEANEDGTYAAEVEELDVEAIEVAVEV
ncbi:cadherin-like beta sandwich domain-containing protein, partial [Acutalibacter caecimuris]|uniref:cadherin-like beta sandwich domain-containing protein n=1 Tax=Acutalibacter caecimuris TaxID=3093657 RepID=UPI002AC9B542